MKKKLLALAVGAAIAAPVSALANAELYGRINLSIDHFDGKEADLAAVTPGIGYDGRTGTYELNSNKSFFGVRGGAELAGGIRGFYQVEFGVFADESFEGADVFFSRNTFLGLETELGSVQAGRFDTPLRAMGASVDQFRDMRYADFANIVAGEWRADNIIQYSTPQIADMLTITVATVAPENEADVTGSGVDNNKLFDTFSVSAMFDMDGFYAGVAYDKNNYGTQGFNGLYLSDAYSDNINDVGVSSFGLGDSNDIYRVVAGMDMDALEVGLLLQQAEDNGSSDKNRSYLLSAGFELSDMIKLKAQYGQTDFRLQGTSNFSARQATIGADYMLGQQTKTFIYTTRQEVDGDRHFAVVGIGAEHRF